MNLDHPNCFGVQNDLDPIKMNWTHPKRLVLDQNDLEVQNNFGTIEGQGNSIKS